MKTSKTIYLAVLFTLGILTINSCSKDNDCTEQTWYQDADGDGFGNTNLPQISCTQPTGYVSDNTDFDDTDASLNPNATDIPDNNIDENGDGSFAYNLYVDNDNDSFGGNGTSTLLVEVPNIINMSSDVPSGYSQNDGDCDDTDNSTYPGAPENTTDGVDNNCNGDIDECAINVQTTTECDCFDGVDNDWDGDTDAADSDC